MKLMVHINLHHVSYGSIWITPLIQTNHFNLDSSNFNLYYNRNGKTMAGILSQKVLTVEGVQI
jgi:hypothetical protein